MNDAMDITGDPDRMCADFPAQKTVHESFERERTAQQPQPDPLIAAMGKMLVASLNREVGLEATIIDLQRRVAELEAR